MSTDTSSRWMGCVNKEKETIFFKQNTYKTFQIYRGVRNTAGNPRHTVTERKEESACYRQDTVQGVWDLLPCHTMQVGWGFMGTSALHIIHRADTTQGA